MSESSITLEVFRYRPEEDGEPTFQTYEVPYHTQWVVLDALNWIKDTQDGTLSYRWSCRMGVCGSCGMMVNGVPRLTCAAFLKDYYPNPIRIEPLTYFPVERDLIIDFEGFLEKLKSITPWLVREEARSLDEGEYLQSPNELASFKQYSMCINCMLCYAACPVVGTEEDFIGPAAMALAQRYNLDSRDQGESMRNEHLGSDDGAWGCTFVGECTEVCPKKVDPAGAIQRSKVANTKDWYLKFLMPWGKR
ncbi:MAG: succinate dehydrogenase/fumarate reductase iron-sulfur subunit [Planctomycetota bacterium]|jgi:fumarate reductase iron-sulfur subunit